MDLRERVNSSLKQAMKDKAKSRLTTLRLINAAIKDQEISARGADGDNLIGVDIEIFDGFLNIGRTVMALLEELMQRSQSDEFCVDFKVAPQSRSQVTTSHSVGSQSQQVAWQEFFDLPFARFFFGTPSPDLPWLPLPC